MDSPPGVGRLLEGSEPTTAPEPRQDLGEVEKWEAESTTQPSAHGPYGSRGSPAPVPTHLHLCMTVRTETTRYCSHQLKSSTPTKTMPHSKLWTHSPFQSCGPRAFWHKAHSHIPTLLTSATQRCKIVPKQALSPPPTHTHTPPIP